MKKKGRKLSYTPEELKAKFEEYLRECESHMVEYPTSRGSVVKYNKPRVPTVEKFCAKLGIWATTLEEWRKPNFVEYKMENYRKGGYEGIDEYEKEIKALHKVANHIWHTIYAFKMDSVVNGDGNVGGLIFDMKVHYNKNDKQIVEHHGGNAIEVSVIRGNNAGDAGENKDSD